METPKRKLGTAYPVRFTEEIEAQIDQASRALGLAKQDIIRMACAIGLEQLKAINYDLAGAVLEKSRAESARQDRDGIALIAEQPSHYGVQKRA
jgi:predicted DNA-binding protein